MIPKEKNLIITETLHLIQKTLSILETNYRTNSMVQNRCLYTSLNNISSINTIFWAKITRRKFFMILALNKNNNHCVKYQSAWMLCLLSSKYTKVQLICILTETWDEESKDKAKSICSRLHDARYQSSCLMKQHWIQHENPTRLSTKRALWKLQMATRKKTSMMMSLVNFSCGKRAWLDGCNDGLHSV